MGFYNSTYLLILEACLAAALLSRRTEDGLFLIRLLVFSALLTEHTVFILFYIFNKERHEWSFIYHFYIAVDYAILSYYFYSNLATLNNRARTLYIASNLFLLFVLILNAVQNGLNTFPGIPLNTEGVFNIAWSIVALLSIRPQLHKSILSIPIFWVSTGVMLYSAGNFFFNFIYQVVLDNHLQLANDLNAYVMKVLNFALYGCFIIAFLWPLQKKKYS